MEEIIITNKKKPPLRKSFKLWAAIKNPIEDNNQNQELLSSLEQIIRAAKVSDRQFIIEHNSIDQFEVIWDWDKNWFQEKPLENIEN